MNFHRFISSVQLLSSIWLFVTPWTAAHQASVSIVNSRYSNSCPSSQWCHPTTSCSIIPFSSCLQSFLYQGLFKWVSSLHQEAKVLEFQFQPVLPMNIQDWFLLWWTGWISLQSKGLSRVFSNTKVQKHQFFGTRLSSQSNSHIHTWPQEKP